ncbi:MAG: efflux RND transporter periplasmic adaptor subunit [Anaerolineaceae bacterium]|nr:efflux RND transporter periplasmic adaptor subunit [Anaerolineaceae bacterium]
MGRRMIIYIVVGALVVIGGIVFIVQHAAATNGDALFSGTIEATEINLPTMSGGVVEQVNVSEGDQIREGQVLVDLYSMTTKKNENVSSPINGVVLERLVEPSEYAAPGSTVMVVASLDDLTLTIYVPENLYGQFFLGQSYPVTVDSFPGQTFNGTVSYISNQAEFTPRNVQTTDSRQTTVYAIKLNLDPSGGMLKPGMPADVHFGGQGQ